MKLRNILFAVLYAVALSSPAISHEGHREDMSDEEMAVASANAEDGEGVTGQGHQTALATPVPVLSVEQAHRIAIERNRAQSLGDFLGRLHPIAAHFPVALLLMAALAELLLMLIPTLGLQPTIRFLVLAGGAGALVAAPLGWFAAGWRLTDRSDTLSLHRWLGTAIAVAGVAALWLVTRKGESRTGLRTIVIVLAAALVVQGYLGGEMVFGPNHLGIR